MTATIMRVRDRRGATVDWSLLGLCPDCWMTPGLPCRDLRYSTGAHFITEPHPSRAAVPIPPHANHEEVP
jgi:hypothetical protein